MLPIVNTFSRSFNRNPWIRFIDFWCGKSRPARCNGRLGPRLLIHAQRRRLKALVPPSRWNSTSFASILTWSFRFKLTIRVATKPLFWGRIRKPQEVWSCAASWLERLAIFGVRRLADILGRTHTLVTSGEWIALRKFSVLRNTFVLRLQFLSVFYIIDYLFAC